MSALVTPASTRRSAIRTAITSFQILALIFSLCMPLTALAVEPAGSPPASPGESLPPAPSDAASPSEAPTDAPTATESPVATDTPAPSAPAENPSPTAPPARPGSAYIVTFGAGADQAASLAAVGATADSSISQLRMAAVALTVDQVSTLSGDPAVIRIDVDRTRAAEAVPNDTGFGDQWSLPTIGWDSVYGSVTPSGSATVALLDTGVDGSHTDLDGNLVAGTSILDGSNGLTDANGHGTAMAGIVAAETDNGEGVAGIGFAAVRVMPVTVLGADGTGQDSDIISGVVWAADHGADVVLMAFSNYGYSPALQAAIDYAWSRGAVLVAATGNDGSTAASFPAGDRGVIGVASTTSSDEVAASSNTGVSAFMAAPGEGILTTALGGGVASVSGTSAAAAEVAASAALLRALDPAATNGVIVGRLARNADPVGDPSSTGNGRLNLARAAADTSTEAVQPAGAAPLGSGGPLVGPYVAATIHVQSVSLGAQSPSSISPGQSATYAVNIAMNGSGSNLGVLLDISTALPAGVSASFSAGGTCRGSDNVDWPSVLTLTTTSGTTLPGTYSFTVRARGYAATNCSGGVADTQTASGSLGVAAPSNTPPVINRTNATVVVPEGQTATNTGTWSDVNAGNTVTLSASVGTVTKSGTNAAGTWSWSFATIDGPAQSQTVTITANDGAGGITSTTFALTVTNVAPTATFNAPTSVNEGSSIGLSFSGASDVSSADQTAGFTYAFDCGSGYGSFSGLSSASCPTNDNGSRTVKGKVQDKDGGFTEYTASVTVNNVPPTATFNAPASVNEGSNIPLALSLPIDPSSIDAGSLTYAFDCGSGYGAFSATASASCATTDEGTRTVKGKIRDKDSGETEYTASVTINNVAPLVTPPVVNAPQNQGASEGVGHTFTLGSFTDPGADSPWSISVNWGDGTSDSLTAATATGPIGTAAHTYVDNGSYTVTITVTDVDGAPGSNTFTVSVANTAPTALLAGDSVDEGSPASVSFSFASDPSTADTTAGFRYSYSCANNPGALAATYAAAGTASSTSCTFDDGSHNYTVVGRIFDKDGGFTDYTTTVHVANVAPTPAIAGAPASSPEGTEISLTGSATDPSAADTTAGFSFSWSVTKDGSPFASGSGASFAFTPDDNGSYVVTLSATDKDGGVGTTSKMIGATNVPPTASFSAPSSVEEGSPIALSLSGDTDVSSADTTAGFTYAFDCGNGAGYGLFGTVAWISCPTSQDASLLVKGQIQDKDGGITEYTATVSVTNVPPTVSAGDDATVAEGSPFSGAGSFSDPGADTWTATVDYGDGDGPVALSLNPDKTFSLSHTYADNGSYAVMVVVSDDDTTGSDTLTVTVENVDPTVDAGADDTINEGATFIGGGSFTDPGADTWTATVDYGDGSGSQVLALNPDGSFSLSHTYADNLAGDASYTVTVTVTDDDGGVGSDTVAVTVLNVAPVVILSGLDQVDESVAPVSYSFTVTDPGADGFTVTEGDIDCGTGGALVAGSLSLVAGGGSFACTFLDGPATPTLSITVADDDLATGADTLDVTVANVKPVYTAPELSLPANQGATEGAAQSFNLGMFTDAGTLDDDWTIDIDWGDGSALQTFTQASQGAIDLTSHTYADGDHDYPVHVTVTDKDGGTDSGTFSIHVANVAPTIAISGASNVDEGSSYSLTLGPVTDPGADTVSAYLVHWGDGQSSSFTATGVVSHIYADGPNVSAITVDLVDEDGTYLDVANALSVTVDNVAPTVSLSGAASVNEGAPYTLTIGPVLDPGSDTVTDYLVDWGDGNSDPITAAALATASGQLSHTYADGPNSYTISVELIDEDGTFANDMTRAVTVLNVAPVVTSPGNQSGNEGASLTVNLGSFSDPGADSPWGVDVNWGDGSGHGSATKSSTGSLGTLTHAYADNGTYVVTVKVTDKDTDFGTVTFQVVVANVAPSPSISGAPATSPEGTAISLGGSATDPSSVDTTAGFTFAWAVSKNGSPNYATGSGASFSFTPNDNGTYLVSLTATDKDGGSATTTATIIGTNVAPATTAGILTIDPITGVVSANVTWGDPGVLDGASVKFEYFRNGSTSSAATSTVAVGANVHTASDNVTQLDPGCFTLTARATITDKDSGVGMRSLTAPATADVWLATFAPPIKQNERNIAKYGNTVPLKVTLNSSCNPAATTTSPSLWVTLIKGSDIAPEGTEIIPASSSGADTGNLMRVQSGGYMYNLTTQGLVQGSDYEVRIRVGSTLGPIIAEALLQPKK